MLKLPPYSKTLQAIQDQDLPYDDYVYIFMGKHSWAKTKHLRISKPAAMCLPPSLESPYQFDWPVQGCEIMLFDTSFTSDFFVNQFVECLFSYGAILILFVSADFQLTVHEKDF